jgi:hypothetical protein
MNAFLRRHEGYTAEGLGITMTDSEIDDAVLAVAEVSWRKVAMIIAKTAERLSGDLPEGDEGYHLVARRIEALVRDGRLVAQGNIKKWRHSEVRRQERDTSK